MVGMRRTPAAKKGEGEQGEKRWVKRADNHKTPGKKHRKKGGRRETSTLKEGCKKGKMGKTFDWQQKNA